MAVAKGGALGFKHLQNVLIEIENLLSFFYVLKFVIQKTYI